jgi:hypothetical protein
MLPYPQLRTSSQPSFHSGQSFNVVEDYPPAFEATNKDCQFTNNKLTTTKAGIVTPPSSLRQRKFMKDG